MTTQKVSIKEVIPNKSNPRIIKDDKFKKLVQSIKDFPKMLEIRPIVVDENNIILGGNMRFKACIEAGFKEVFIIKANGLTEEQKHEFIVKDNVGFGEWDWDILANEWDINILADFGLNLPISVDDINKMTDSEIDDSLNGFTDDNCHLPIAPIFHEKYSYFIILTENEIDEAFVRNTFELEKKHKADKKTDTRLSNIIDFKKLQEVCLK